MECKRGKNNLFTLFNYSSIELDTEQKKTIFYLCCLTARKKNYNTFSILSASFLAKKKSAKNTDFFPSICFCFSLKVKHLLAPNEFVYAVEQDFFSLAWHLACTCLCVDWVPCSCVCVCVKLPGFVSVPLYNCLQWKFAKCIQQLGAIGVYCTSMVVLGTVPDNNGFTLSSMPWFFLCYLHWQSNLRRFLSNWLIWFATKILERKISFDRFRRLSSKTIWQVFHHFLCCFSTIFLHIWTSVHDVDIIDQSFHSLRSCFLSHCKKQKQQQTFQIKCIHISIGQRTLAFVVFCLLLLVFTSLVYGMN